MFNRFMQWLVPKLEEWCIKKDRTFWISGTDDPENVYLRRYVLFRSKYFSIYIHRFMRSDKDDHHDHPFDFVGYVVTKGYSESRLQGYRELLFLRNGQFSIGQRKPGTWGFRKAEDIHMVELDRSYTMDEYKEAPLTVIFRGPYRREWGFWKPSSWRKNCFTWVKWTTYLGVPESDVRE
jgi:hypothetical protein